MNKPEEIHGRVKDAYGRVARGSGSCCGTSSCCGGAAGTDHPVPEADLGLSCGNPVAFTHLAEGDVVLDLGSGAGKDVFLAAQQVGAKGRVIGVDMTQEMLDLARRNAEKFRVRTGLENVEFREGQIEALPVEDAAVDVVISNCVINLSPDKAQVFREAFRALKPGGRMIVSDIVLNRPLPDSARDDDRLYNACLAGALLREAYLGAVRAAGFGSILIISDNHYRASDVGGDPFTAEVAAALEGAASSITVLALKPAQSGCGCSGGCCKQMKSEN